jgi:hypothetical protein
MLEFIKQVNASIVDPAFIARECILEALKQVGELRTKVKNGS